MERILTCLLHFHTQKLHSIVSLLVGELINPGRWAQMLRYWWVIWKCVQGPSTHPFQCVPHQASEEWPGTPGWQEKLLGTMYRCHRSESRCQHHCTPSTSVSGWEDRNILSSCPAGCFSDTDIHLTRKSSLYYSGSWPQHSMCWELALIFFTSFCRSSHYFISSINSLFLIVQPAVEKKSRRALHSSRRWKTAL